MPPSNRLTRIPRVIHWCWFGRTGLPALTQRCITSWKTHLPDYRIVLWNEDNFDVSSNRYVREAYEAKKWAFVSDYARAFILATHGGVYLDADVEVRRNLDPFLAHGAFSGFESPLMPVTATWAAERGHPWPKAVLDHYATRSFLGPTGPILTPNTITITQILEAQFGIQPIFDTFQLGTDDIAIYPSDTLCRDTPTSFTVHHFAGSWLDSKVAIETGSLHALSLHAHRLEGEIAAMRASTSWRVTAPLRRFREWLNQPRRRNQ